ncbi:H-type small acid-soluble spore protein [Aquibacillus koreensis]|uniref:Small, acid-soluble spore protein H n=1 Tax=Aquibacillus koreensis TaxID=279446 RepID=A0A9X3WPI0_9BACI|nr:H-type small acid-soluble spore protein [Aquibacillus koreensis]MCT2537765.1 H-type small acid-soluble spore protein [Aquibacillus koreensis]MDC3421201.1 H-type small acid-soluble spore protein [Aquibacillus koreensis]
MNTQRAKEIVDAASMINVTYDGTPIYIQHVNESENTARVFPVDQPENERDVPLDQLREER